jgi:hypothetical protein
MPTGAPEMCCEDVLNLLRVFEYSDEPEDIKAVFGRLCEYFAWAARRGIDAVPCRDTGNAIPLAQYSALFTRVVALRMTGQGGNAEEPPLGALKGIAPDQAFGWAPPPNRPPELKGERFERDYAMAACVELFERKDSGRGKRKRAVERVAQLHNCKERRVRAALSFFARAGVGFGHLSTTELEEIRGDIKPLSPRAL